MDRPDVIPGMEVEVSGSAPAPAAPAPSPAPAPNPESGGNAPVPTPSVDTPPAPTVDTPPAPAEPQLYDLPDGRKVDAATLTREWKENFLPDYTRKSQALADKERNTNPTPPATEPSWKSPDWQPTTYAEIIELAKQDVFKSLQDAQAQEQQQRQAIEKQVEGQIATIKAVDKNLNEATLFAHANKYGFTDLKLAYDNMQEISRATKEAETRVLGNIKKRETDPVAVPGANPVADDGYDPNENRQFGSAVEFLQRMKGKK